MGAYSVASLERFRAMTGHTDLELLWKKRRPIQLWLSRLSFLLRPRSLAILMVRSPRWRWGQRLVSFKWRGCTLATTTRHRFRTDIVYSRSARNRTRDLLALIGSGLQVAELLRLRVGDVGSLDGEGRLVPDIAADPLAVQYTPRRGKQGERITFLTYSTRQALLAAWQQGTIQQDAAQPIDLNRRSLRSAMVLKRLC